MLFVIFIGFERKIEETSAEVKLEIKLYKGVQLESYMAQLFWRQTSKVLKLILFNLI